MANEITSNQQLGPTKQDLVAELVQRELKAAVNMLPSVDDVSNLAVRGAKKIKIPRLSSFQVVNRQSGQAGTAQALDSSVDELDLDQNLFLQWVIDNFDEIQSNIPAQAEFASRAAQAHGRKVDELIIEELEGAGVAESTASGDITESIFLEMRKSLLKRNANRDGLWFAASPDQEAELLQISRFVEADKFGRAVIPEGAVTRIHGVNIVINNQLDAQQYFMYDTAGVKVAFQQRPNTVSEPDSDFGTQARKFTMDQILGLMASQVGIDPKEEGLASTESPLIVKDNN